MTAPPPTAPPPNLHVGSGAPDFLPGAITSIDPNSVDAIGTVKVLCQHVMKASEMTHLVEAEIRQLRAENAALRRELSASVHQVARFEPAYEGVHSSPEATSLKSLRSSADVGPSVNNNKSQMTAWTVKTTEDHINQPTTGKKRLGSGVVRSLSTAAADKQAGLIANRNARIKANLLFDPERIKTRLREAIVKPVYDVTKFYHTEGCAQAIARSIAFDNITLVVILLNAIWIAVDTQHNRAEVLVDADPVFQVAEQLFCTYFFAEWLIRFASFKRKRDCRRDAWFVFDTVLMTTMVLETWIMTAILLSFQEQDGGGSSLGVMKNASLIRMLRLLRITRLARAVKLLRISPEIMVMLKAVLSSMRCVLWTFVLLICIVFFFSVGFTQLCRGSALEHSYFNSLTMSMHTLLLAGVFPDLQDMSMEISNEHILYWIFWMFFMLLASLAILNLLVGVLVEIVKASSNVERDAMDVAYTRHTFMKVLGIQKYEEDAAHIESLQFSKEQFVDLMQDDSIVATLLKIGIDILGLVDLVDWIFMSGDRKFTELLEVILQLRSSATVTVRDIVDLRKFLTFEIHRIQASLHSMKHRIPDTSPVPELKLPAPEASPDF